MLLEKLKTEYLLNVQTISAFANEKKTRKRRTENAFKEALTDLN